MKSVIRIFVGVALAAALQTSVFAQAMTDYLENKIVDWLFRAQSYTPPATIYVGLLTGACSDSSAGTEVSGGSYARAAVTSGLSAWAGTQSADSTTASSGTSGQTSNNAAIAFPAPSGSWGQVTHFALYDAASGGNQMICQALAAPKSINNGDAAPEFGIGALTVTFQ